MSHKSWTIIEEVFLVGAVVDMFLSRGSLSPKHYGESCWLVIKRNYDLAWGKYLACLKEYKEGNIPQEKQSEFPFLKTMYHTTIDNHERTQGAMARHFKEMKDRCAKGTTRNFSYFLREWEEIYNVNFCLLPPSQSTNAKDVQIEEERSRNPRLAALARVGQNIHYEGRWTQQDEVFLIAAVVNRFLKTGSLASPRGSGDQACWKSIHENFEWLQHQAFKISGQKARPKRTVTALLRRFKLIKEHQTSKKSIRALYHDWKKFYCTNGSDQPNAPPHSPAHGSTVQQIVTIPAAFSKPSGPCSTDMSTLGSSSSLPNNGQENANAEQVKATGEAAETLQALAKPSVETPPSAPTAAAKPEKPPQSEEQSSGEKDSNEKQAKSSNGPSAEDTGKVAEDGVGIDMRLVNKLNAVVDNRPTPKTRVRIKWTAWDVSCLWNGIQLFGNSWSEIRKNFLPLRTTDQVKDKGKRLLRRVGWKTGRTKKFFYKASEEAKEIARITCNKRSIPRINSYNDRAALAKVASTGVEPSQEEPDCDFGELEQYKMVAAEVAATMERKMRIDETKRTLECVLQEVVSRSREKGAGFYPLDTAGNSKTSEGTVSKDGQDNATSSSVGEGQVGGAEKQGCSTKATTISSV